MRTGAACVRMPGVTSPRIQAALDNAASAAARAPHSAPPESSPPERRIRVAIGDPQADLTRFLAILDRHGLLTERGWLAPDVQLVSVGDHFDWGKAHERDAVAQSALRLVAWLAAHPADQVVILAGNHDLGRVGELADFTDATFASAQAEADRHLRRRRHRRGCGSEPSSTGSRRCPRWSWWRATSARSARSSARG